MAAHGDWESTNCFDEGDVLEDAFCAKEINLSLAKLALRWVDDCRP